MYVESDFRDVEQAPTFAFHIFSTTAVPVPHFDISLIYLFQRPIPTIEISHLPVVLDLISSVGH